MKKFLLAVTTGTAITLSIVWTRHILSAEAPLIPSAHEPSTITIGWVGDMVPSDDATYNTSVFANVQGLLEQPDLMIGNLEGTFADSDRTSKCLAPVPSCFAFRGDPAFATALKDAGFDLVSLVNNHSFDYGKDGLTDTEAVLDAADIPYISPTKTTASIVVKGKRIGILGLSFTDGDIKTYAYIQKQAAELKATNDFVIVIFHGGAEGADKTAVTGAEEFQGSEDRGNVELAAHTAINAGADVVLGSGPHVLRKIEQYKNGLIAYSLGNFEGGDGELDTSGILGDSGIIMVTLTPDAAPTHTFTSIHLSPNGIPFPDPTDTGKNLVENLSKIK
ncbi:MAG TPA: CapA family protein [Candidatus Paceibacterota bacterium]|nr:CapA family protein [Candidatus Paceibacterota bacterium]